MTHDTSWRWRSRTRETATPTGAICGNILGALHGETAVPAELVFQVQGRGTILQLADDFILEFTQSSRLHGEYGPKTSWRLRYPGW